MRHIRLGSMTVIVLALVLHDCSCDEDVSPPPRGDELEYELFDGTTLLDEADLAVLTEASDGELRFSSVPAALSAVQPLDVVVGGISPASPRGFMRLVLAVDDSGPGLVLSTTDAPIQLAFRSIHVRATRALPGGETDPTYVGRLEQGLTFGQDAIMEWPLDEPLYDIDGNPDSTYDQVSSKGLLRAGMTYTFTIDADWGALAGGIDAAKECVSKWASFDFSSCNPLNLLPEIKATMELDVLAEAELALQGVSFLGYESSFPLYEEPLEPIPIGPFVFVPHLEIEAHYSGSASSQFNWQAGGHFLASAKLSASSKSLTPTIDVPSPDIAFTHGDIDAVLQAEGGLEIGPRLSILLENVAGPSAALFLGARIQADADETPCWHLTGTTHGAIGIFIGIKEIDVTLIDQEVPFGLGEVEIATGACSPAPIGAETPPVGGEPTIAAFQNPTFTPWATAYDSTVDGTPQQGPGAQLEWAQLTPTIDGRMWLSGSDVRVLHSLDADGSLVWAKRYIADVSFWNDTLFPDLLITRSVPTTDAAMMVLAHPYTLMKLDPEGELFFAKHFEVPAYRETWLRFTAIVADESGGYYVSGTIGDSIVYTEQRDAWLLRIDKRANVLWSRRIGDSVWGEDIRVLLPLADGVVAAGARFEPTGVSWHAPLWRFDANGELVWSRELLANDCDYGSEQPLWITTGLESADGDLIFGASVENGFVGYEGLVFKVQPETGAVPWSQGLRTNLSGALGPRLTALVQLPTSGYLAAGTLSDEQVRQDWWLAGLDAAGQAQWMKRLGGYENQSNSSYREDNYPAIQLTQDGGAVLAGYTETFVDNGTWAVKVAARDGALNFDPGVGSIAGDLPYVIDGSCITAVDVSIPVVDDAIAPLAPLTVAVEPVTLTTRPLTP